jgi:hypothetical protein
VGGIVHPVSLVSDATGGHAVQFVLSPGVPSGVQAVSVGVGTRYSLAFAIAVQR